MSTNDNDAEVNDIENNVRQIRTETASETRSSRSLTALRSMTALYQSLPARSHDSEQAARSVVSHELPFSSTTPHSINDILARSRRFTSPAPLPLQSSAGRTSLSTFQTNVSVSKSPIVRLASPVGLAVRAAPGSGSSSLYWAAAAAASLMSPSLCWNHRGTWTTKQY